MRFVKVLFLVLLFVLSILFFNQNDAFLSQANQLVLDIPYIASFKSVPLPYYLIVLIAFAAGSILTMLYFLADKFRGSAKLKECRTRMASLEQELNSLRTMPINDDPSLPATSEEEKKDEQN
ncbi:LapA family protein [Pseudodesulfovibrio tunisiensis]|uniref:LapA family protein n=1 Tax=Pseudodesulfovibrio tunisiensis TaxID=463192 RepID=UPI001FB2BF05|nr:LapA family protein [Pseudodesulfovibrio tunisiensis]